MHGVTQFFLYPTDELTIHKQGEKSENNTTIVQKKCKKSSLSIFDDFPSSFVSDGIKITGDVHDVQDVHLFSYFKEQFGNGKKSRENENNKIRKTLDMVDMVDVHDFELM